MVHWKPGDLSPSGIGLTACYLVLAVACFVIAYREDGGPMHRRRLRHPVRTTVWNILGAALLLVAIERQLGLLDLVTDLMRAKAEIEGDYASRRVGQVEMLRLIGAAAVTIAALLGALAGRAGRYAALQAVVVTTMVTYLTVKAVSLHRVDQLLSRHVSGIALGNWLEFGLVSMATMIVLMALRSMRDVRRPRSRVRH